MTDENTSQSPCEYGQCPFRYIGMGEIVGDPGGKKPCKHCFIQIADSPQTLEPARWRRTPDLNEGL